MKLNNWKICAATLMFGTWIMVPIKAKADQTSDDQACLTTQNVQNATCTTAKNAIDTAAATLYDNTIISDAAAEQGKVNSDLATQQIKDAACEATEWGFIGNPSIPNDVGSCGKAQIASDIAAHTAYQKGINNCSTATDQTACECLLQPTLTFTLNQDQATYANCISVNQHIFSDSCHPGTVLVQNQSDADAKADQALADAKAQAVYSQTTVVEDNFTYPLCISASETAYENCVDGVDCNYNKPPALNCCYDNAAEAWNTALLNAYTIYVNAVGAADGTYQHDYPLCGAQQAHDDAVASDLNTYSYGVANDTYYLQIDLANDAYTQSQSTDINQCALDTATCACKYPNPSSNYTLCATAATANAALSDKQALATYNAVSYVPPQVPTGSAYTTCVTAKQLADKALAATQAADAKTAGTCQTAASAALNNVINAQTLVFNNAQNAAQKIYTDAINACNAG